MTSGVFGSVAIDDVTISDRIRKKKRSDYERLKRSISRRGLLHPIVIDRNSILVAGEGRITACRELGWTHIPYQYTDELDPHALRMLELEENNAREDLSWEEQHNQYMEQAAYLREDRPNITDSEIAEELNIDKSTFSIHFVYEEAKNIPAVKEAAKSGGLRTAYNVAVRVLDRALKDSTIHDVCPSNHTPQSPILTADFHLWAPIYSGPTFNLIHCDFPYGIDADQHQGQNSQLRADYTDTPDDYWALLDTLTLHLDRFCAESAHLFFWFSPQHYTRTLAALENLDGFKFDHYPLVWQRGENEGIAPDPARRPRRVYETAFFGWRNDRKIIRTKANSIVAPTTRDIHSHEKSVVALQHFFEMCVDGNTRLFDPTCGSGSALRAARILGAREVFGLESNPEYADAARRALEP